METLNTKTLLYDHECPLCSWYTEKFMEMGVLGANGRTPFEKVPESLVCQFDPDRARHEIALVDDQGAETLYGIDSLFLIVGTAAPVLQPVLRFAPFRKAMQGLYNFISYNRRVIAGQSSSGACAPDFHLGWRLAYVAFAATLYFLSAWALGTLAMGHGLEFQAGPQGLAGIFLAAYLPHLAFGLVKLRTHNDFIGHLATTMIIHAGIILVSLLPLAFGMGGMTIVVNMIGLVVSNAVLLNRLQVLKMSALPAIALIPTQLAMTFLTLNFHVLFFA
ncbi:MAG: DUF393 domain-containing protein [Bacteroidia bacterium]|nr:DUF393 domain-containing protein [Bacteroidia bacterium]